MSPLPKRVGTAEEEVLFAVIRRGGTWNTNGPSLYESKVFTIGILDRLVGRGFMEESAQPDRTVYRATEAAHRWVDRQSLPY